MLEVLRLSKPLFCSGLVTFSFRSYSSAVGNAIKPPNEDDSAFQQNATTYDAFDNVQRSTKPYKLQPLSRETCTRVLTIHPSYDKSTPVALSIDEVDLAGTYEPFVAVSHVWGANPQYDRFTICNDEPRRITGRIDSILRRIRSKISDDDRYKHWNRVWIDTLCIDQSDSIVARSEKSHQVSMMHKVFGDAQEVIVDMGQANRYSHLLPNAKQDIIHLCDKAFDDEYCKDILGFPSSVKVEAKEAHRIRQSLEACSRLLDKQWMCRIWAVQEYALARKCSFLMGHVVIDGEILDELGRLASAANLRGRSHLALIFSKFRRALALTKVPQLASIHEEGRDLANKLNFGPALALGWHHECTDERDTVYALRALVDYGERPLRVDYNEPTHLLAGRVTHKLIELGEYEAALAGARGLASSAVAYCQPSWSFLMRPTFKFVGEERHWILSGKPNKFRAGGRGSLPIPPLTFFPNTRDYLQAKVAVIDAIAAVSDHLPRIPQYGSNPKLPVERLYTYNTERTIHTRAVIINAWLRYTLPQLNKARKQRSHLDRRSEEHWRTTTHGHNGMEFDTQDPYPQQKIDYWNMLVDMSLNGLETLGYKHNPNAKLANDIQALETAMRKRHVLMAELVRKPQAWIDAIHHEFDLLGDPHKRGLARLLSKARAISKQAAQETHTTQENMLRQVALNTYLVNEAFDFRKVRAMDQLKMLERRLAVLQDGRLISVPNTADVGDVVVLLPGISVPYVLRRVHDSFKIVGMAYVDGIMHGEAVVDGLEWQTIKIT